MISIRRLTTGLAALLAITPLLAASAAPDTARMEEIVQSYVKSNQFMGTVLVVQDGKVLLDKAYGNANLEWQIPNSSETVFRLGSNTKQFTAAAIFLLADRDKLRIDDPVKKYLADAPKAWDHVTIYNLLTHTAGIPNYTEFPEFAKRQLSPATPQELVALFRDKPLEFAPGTKWNYSNSGYALLGYIIEKVSGVSYARFVADNIFKPLGMTQSGFDSAKMILPRRASGYMPGPNGLENAGYVDMSVMYAAGGLYSTTHDLRKWQEGLFGGKLLSAASLKRMTTPFLENYACGVFAGNVGGHTDYAHGGGVEGFNTQLDYVPDQKLSVVVLGNLNSPAPFAIGNALVKVALGEKVVMNSERQTAAIDPKTFDRLAGTYQVAPGFAVTFEREGEHYFVHPSGQPRFEIYPKNEREYFAKVGELQFAFVVGADGSVNEVIVTNNGKEMHASRTKSTQEPAH